MRLRDALGVVAIVAATALCVRLGFWQLSRLHERRAANAALRAALEAPAREAGAEWPAESLGGRRVRLTGHFDSRFEVLLRGRMHEGSPGVEVATPWLLAGDSTAVMVQRGWLPAADGATLAAESVPLDSAQAVTGFGASFDSRGPAYALRVLERGRRTLWSAARLDRDSLAARLPYALANWWLAALPDSGAPAAPRRSPPAFRSEAMHLGYAIQWFGIATLIPVAAFVLARRRRGTRAGGQSTPA